MAKTNFKSVDAYIAAQPEAARAVLERVRGAVRKALPDAEEAISYQIPAFKLGGKAVLFIAGWKQHFSLYPANEALVAAFEKELADYECNKKGTIRIKLTQPVPVGLIERIARFRAQEVAKEQKAKGRVAKGASAKPKSATPHVQLHKDGSVWAKGQTLDGQPTGYWEWFRKDGTKMRSGTFENGQQVGEWTTYDKTGEVYKVTTIKRRPSA